MRGCEASVCEGQEMGGLKPPQPPWFQCLSSWVRYVDSQVPSSATLTAWLARVQGQEILGLMELTIYEICVYVHLQKIMIYFIDTYVTELNIHAELYNYS